MPKIWDLFEHPVKNFSGFTALVREYRSRQERNIENNVGASYVLDIQKRSVFSFLPSPIYDCTGQDSILSAPTILGTKRRPVITNLAHLPVNSIEIALTTPICVGAPRLSQVWKAVAGDGATVVVKIFQACFSNEPEWYHNMSVNFIPEEKKTHQEACPDPYVDFIPEEEMAHREAWAYSRLKDMQGLTIPHSYGFYDIKVPSGDVVCAHVMEYIEGTSAERFAIFMRHQEKYDTVRDKIMTRAMEFLFYIHQRGVLHRDFTSRNILCPENSPEDCVVIDFGFAKSSADPIAIEKRAEGMDTAEIFPLFVNIYSRFGAYTWLENKAAEMRGNQPWIKFLLKIRGRSKWDEWRPIEDHYYKSALRSDERRDAYEADLKSKGVESYYYSRKVDTRKSSYYCRSGVRYLGMGDNNGDPLEP